MSGIHTYVNPVTADYVDTELSVTPQRVIVEMGDKAQIIHEADDGSMSVTTLSLNSIFNIKLQWDVITVAETEIIFDFYHNQSKVNGRERTFYWHHTIDGHIYTVRFLDPLGISLPVAIPGHREISQITLRVVGSKP